MTYDGLELLPQHAAQLSDSSISLEVAAARGYRSIERKKDLNLLGFARSQQRVPCLLAPVFWKEDDPVLHQIRPDSPRTVRGKTVKYEIKGAASMRLDVSPIVRHLLDDPGVPLWITEGIKKGDALASRGLCAVSLIGVWAWRGTNRKGGRVALPEWEDAALNDRQVNIAFDSDVMTKPEVHAALVRLKAFLERRGAHVVLIYLPAGPEGRKQGVDDFLAAGNDVRDLMQFASTALRPAKVDGRNETEMLDTEPLFIRRPLCIVGDRAYAVTWPWIRRTTFMTVDHKTDEVQRHDPPVVKQDRGFAIVRDDGVLFSNDPVDGAKPLSEIGLEIRIPRTAPAEATWSGAGVKRYVDGRRPDPADLLRRIADVTGTFMDFDRSLAPQEVMCELTACYVMATYFLDAFSVFGYLWPTGDKGAGKTVFLFVVCLQACLGRVVLAGGSFASLRDLADLGATIGFDDAEDVMDRRKGDPDKQALLLAGNRRGVTVPVKEQDSKNRWTTRHVFAFCPRLFSAIKLPSPVLASRSIMIPLVRSSDSRKANADPCETDTWPHDRVTLIDDLWATGLANVKTIREYDRKAAARARLSGRNLQPWRPILAVALWLQDEHSVSGLFDRLEQLSVDYQKERADLEASDPVRVALLCLGEMFEGYSGNQLTFETTDLSRRMNRKAVELDLADQGEGASDFTNPRKAGRLMGQLRLIEGPRIANHRHWKISRAEFLAKAKAYGIDVDVRDEPGTDMEPEIVTVDL